MSRKILVADRGEFYEVTRGLCKDINYAQIHWRMWRDLCKAVEEHPLVWAEANAFWELTINAHSESALARLTRAYDYHNDALSLNAWLLTIQANYIEIFPDQTTSGRKIDLQQLAKDIRETAKDDTLVGRLVKFRDTVQAHTSVFRFKPLPTQLLDHTEITLTGDDVDALIHRADSVLSRYTLIFDNEVFPGWVVGQDSYKVIFKIVEESINRTIAARNDFAAKFSE